MIRRLADAFDRAAHDVFSASEAHAHYEDLPPTTLDNWVYYCRGFVAGLICDSESVPLVERLNNWAGKLFRRTAGRIRAESD